MAKKAIFDQKNILVAGGAGFVGSHLCDELISESKVICLDNFLTGKESNIAHLLQKPNFKLIRHDITAPIELERQPELADFKFAFQGLQEIYFLASPTSPKAYTQYPLETLAANSVGLRQALDMAVKYKAKFLYASSAAVYGDDFSGQAGPLKEDFVGAVDQLGPRACYSEAQRFGETLVANYRQKYDLDAKIVRIGNAYGPRMRLGDGRMIPEMIQFAVANRNIIIHGDKDSGGAYFFIDDLIKALTRIMETAELGPMNLSSDWTATFAEVANKIITLTGAKAKIKFKGFEAWMAPQPVLDIVLAKEKLGWFPIVLLDEGLLRTIDYLSAQQGIRESEAAAA